MKFNFAFEKLLEHREQQEGLARREWVEAQTQVDEANGVLREMFEQIDNSRQRAAKAEREGGARGAELVQIDQFINGQKIRIETQRAKIRELMIVAEAKHEALIEAARERKTIEKLREKKLEEYKQIRKKMELKRNDELVVTRFRHVDQESGSE